MPRRDRWRASLLIESLLALWLAARRLERADGGTALLADLVGTEAQVEAYPQPAASALNEARAAGRMVGRVARCLPSRPTCLPQALALQSMLWRRGIPCRLRLGARLEGTAFKAHAWVVVGDTVVGGGIAGLVDFRMLVQPPGRPGR